MRYLLVLLILILILFSCTNEQDTVLIGAFDNEFNDTLRVADLMGTMESIDTIFVNSGRFEYRIKTANDDIRIVSNQNGNIDFNFLTIPGKYNIKFKNNDFEIEGDLNKEINRLYYVSKSLLLEKQRINSKDLNGIARHQEIKMLNERIISHLLTSTKNNKNNPISAIGPFASYILLDEDNTIFDTLFSYVNQSTLKHTSLGEQLQLMKARRTNPQFLPDAVLLDIYSEEYKINNSNQEYLFIDFWASWCKPCIQQIPELKEVYQKYKSTNKVNFISVSIDEYTDNWINAVNKEDMEWKQVIVKDKSNHNILKKHWGITSIPHGVLIGPGNVTHQNYIRTVKELDILLSEIDVF